jgi:hypothetical protein
MTRSGRRQRSGHDVTERKGMAVQSDLTCFRRSVRDVNAHNACAEKENARFHTIIERSKSSRNFLGKPMVFSTRDLKDVIA